MSKGKMFLIVGVLAIAMIGCAHVGEGTFIQGAITEVDEENREIEMEIESWTTVGHEGDFKDSYEFEGTTKTQSIRVSNPKDYDVGQTIQVKVIKNYEEDVWDVDRLNFEVEKVN